MKYIITQAGNRTFCGLFEEGRFLQIDLMDAGAGEVGNIYVGKVQNILANIAAAFVEYQPGKIAYLSLEDARYPVYVRKNGKKEDLSAGDEILVEVTRDAIKTKQPAVSCQLTLPGTLAVLIGGSDALGISSKITEPARRKQIKQAVRPFCEDHLGFVIRTDAKEAEEEDLLSELADLKQQYLDLCAKGSHCSAFTCLRETKTSFFGSLSKADKGSLTEIVTDLADFREGLQREIKKEQLSCSLRFHEDEVSLSRIYKIDAVLSKALQPKVWMPSGAYLVIEQTEALTVIDVNSGKAIRGSSNLQETFLKINLEAAKEAARQIRLRNLSGIILVDFIDLSAESAKKSLVASLKGYLAEDPVPCRFVDMTKLQLAEITRKKIRPSLKEQAETQVE